MYLFDHGPAPQPAVRFAALPARAGAPVPEDPMPDDRLSYQQMRDVIAREKDRLPGELRELLQTALTNAWIVFPHVCAAHVEMVPAPETGGASLKVTLTARGTPEALGISYRAWACRWERRVPRHAQHLLRLAYAQAPEA